jgi:hypothetical protein
MTRNRREAPLDVNSLPQGWLSLLAQGTDTLR